jgi:tetratricopeptide (TPR) repeat protein
MRKMTPEKFAAEHKLFWKNPEKYIEMVNGFIRENPDDSTEYFSRHQAWARLGKLDKALEDLNQSISLEDKVISRLARGSILCRMGRYQEALGDFNRSEEFDPVGWADCWGPLYRANCHARLGDERAALADCERLPEDFWSPGIYGEPAGNKTEITAEIRRRARAAKQNPKS